jgi:hypothetical protein
MTSRIGRVLLIACAAAGLLVGCGDDDDATTTSSTSPPTETRPGGNQAATTPPATGDTLPEVEGDEFTDPDGTYEIEIDPEWERDDARADPGIEFWLVAKEFDGFFPNVNLLTQTVPLGTKLDEYLDLSVDGMDDYIDDADMIDRRTVDGAGAQELGLLEYTGAVDGIDLHFLQLVVVDGDEAVVATFTAPDGRFEDLRPQIEPYLHTLRPS